MANDTPGDEHQPAPRATAVLDEAHLGDIQGAFGTIRVQDVGARRTWRAVCSRSLPSSARGSSSWSVITTLEA